MALARTVLPVPGHVLDQQVAAAQQRDQRQADFVVLADDDALDVGEDLVAGFLDLASSASLAGSAACGPASGSDWECGAGRACVVSRDSTSVVDGPRSAMVSCPSAIAPTFRATGWPASAAEQGQPADPRASSGSRSPPITARNSSPPTQAATATPPNSAASTSGDRRQPDALDHRAAARAAARRRRSASLGSLRRVGHASP